MTYVEVAPGRALRDRVACFWVHASPGGSHRVLPDGAMDIIVRLGADDAAVVGAMTRAITVATAAASVTVGVRFRPGAAFDLVGVAARELRDDQATLDGVWGATGRAIAAEIAAAPSADAAIARLAAHLVRRPAALRAPDPRLARAIASLDGAGGELPIGAVAAGVGLSERQLERLFDERVGIGPKLYARVARLERARSWLDRGAGSWADIALACGYTDQAHLTREFRALTGLTPAAFARVRRASEIDNRAPAPLATLGP